MRSPRQLHQNLILNRRSAGRAANTATSVMSRSRSQGTEVTTVTGDVPSRAFTRHHGEFLRYGNDIQSRRERGYEQPVQVHSAKIKHTHNSHQ